MRSRKREAMSWNETGVIDSYLDLTLLHSVAPACNNAWLLPHAIATDRRKQTPYEKNEITKRGTESIATMSRLDNSDRRDPAIMSIGAPTSHPKNVLVIPNTTGFRTGWS